MVLRPALFFANGFSKIRSCQFGGYSVLNTREGAMRLAQWGLGVVLLAAWMVGCGSDDDDGGGDAKGGTGATGGTGGTGGTGTGGTGGTQQTGGTGGTQQTGGTGGTQQTGGTGGTQQTGGTGGTGGQSNYTGTMNCGNIPLMDAACAACADTECCDDGNACAEEPKCLALADCLGYCEADDEDCVTACFTANADGASLYMSLFACTSHNCTSACQAPAEAACGITFQNADCNSCGVQKCCDAMYDAGHSAEFWDNNDCTTSCPANDNACFVACIVEYQQGFALGAVLDNCLLTECNNECLTTPGTSVCGRAEFNDATCNACLETSCCDEWKSLGGHLDHWLFRLCNTACPTGDTACAEDCLTAHVDGAAMWGSSIGCMATHCSTECAAIFPDLAPCGGLAMTSTAVACGPCVDTNCCDELIALGTDYEWWARMYCDGACNEGDEDCHSACVKAHPKGLALDIWAGSCIGTNCATECEIDPPPVCGNSYYEDVTADCPVCIEANCCDEENACWSSLDCAQSLVCRMVCEEETTCLANCDTEFATGAALADAAITCGEDHCESECAGAAGAAGSGP